MDSEPEDIGPLTASVRAILWGQLSDEQLLERYRLTASGTDGAAAIAEELVRRGVTVPLNKNTWLSGKIRQILHRLIA